MVRSKTIRTFSKEFRHDSRNCYMDVQRKILRKFFMEILQPNVYEYREDFQNIFFWKNKFLYEFLKRAKKSDFLKKVLGMLLETALVVSRRTFWRLILKKIINSPLFPKFSWQGGQNCIPGVQKIFWGKLIVSKKFFMAMSGLIAKNFWNFDKPFLYSCRNFSIDVEKRVPWNKKIALNVADCLL